MAFTQQTFLGASIASFDVSIARGDGVAQLNVKLYVDPDNGDTTPTFVTGAVKVGYPVYFSYGDFSFGGIITNWQESASQSAYYEYNVTVSDAREILSGVQVIVSDYAGPSYIPNVYNVYGYMESFGYGNSGHNESGMPLYNVVSSLAILTATTPIKFRGDIAAGQTLSFGLDLTELPIFSANYRIAGPNITVLELIDQVCSDAGYDYYFDLVAGIVKLRVISRVGQTLSFSAIRDFVTSVDGVMSYESGRELRNDTTSKMIVGGPRIDVYFQDYNGGTDDLANIWPFWGFDATGKAILGTGTDNNHTFSVDARHLDVLGVGATYEMDVAELRAAAAGDKSWKNFLRIRNGISGTPQYKRADRIGLAGGLSENLLALFQQNPPPSPVELQSMTSQQINAMIKANTIASNRIKESVNRLYEFVKKYANEYYGRKFMVNLPFLISNGVIQDSETGEYTLIKKPVSAGWIDESSSTLADLVSSGYIPSNFNRSTVEDGRIKVMVKFSNYALYDFSDISPDSIIVNGSDVFILADVEENKAVTTGDGIPRAVITLPGSVSPRTTGDIADLGGILDLLFAEAEKTNSGITPAYKKDFKQNSNLWSQSWEWGPLAVLPHTVVLPLEDSQNTYGPWYAAGASGKVDFEYATDLVPWNFGSEAAMNLVGNARVQSAITYSMELESGSVTFPDAPSKTIGEQLIASGPYITDIQVNIGRSGASTTYRMATWASRLNQGMTSAQLASFQKIAKSQQLSRRRLRDYIAKNAAPKQFYQDRANIITDSLKNNTSNAVLVAKKTKKDNSNKTSKTEVSSTNVEDSSVGITEDYQDSAAATWDAIYGPYSTEAFFGDGESNPAAFPYFDTIDETTKPTTSVPYKDELDPFKGEHDVQMMTTGTEVPADGLTDTTSDNYRSFGLRGPVMMVGYGRDAYGFPIPNKYDDSDSPSSVDVDSYADNHKKRRDIWKPAPFDATYDPERGVWYSSPVILEGYLDEDLEEYGMTDASGIRTYPESGAYAAMKVFRVDKRNGAFSWSGETINVCNRDHTLSASSGVYTQVRKIGDEYRPIWVGCE